MKWKDRHRARERGREREGMMQRERERLKFIKQIQLGNVHGLPEELSTNQIKPHM